MVKVIYNKFKKEWIVLPLGDRREGSIYLDGFIYRSFTKAKKIMERKEVYLPVLGSGYPGTGKTTLFINLATFCDPTFTEKRVYFKPQDFIDALKKASPLQAYLLDEGYEGLSTAQIRKKVGRTLKLVLNIIRKKRLYIFIIIPDFFDLNKSTATFLTRWLFHCYEKTFGEIGQTALFDRDKKRELYMKGKRFGDYDCVKADAVATFTKAIPKTFNWITYNKAKDEYIKELDLEESDSDSGYKSQRNELIKHCRFHHKESSEEIGELIELSTRQVQRIIKQDP